MPENAVSLMVASKSVAGRYTNRDSMLSFIPHETQAMINKGALFVVADGFLGHGLTARQGSQIAIDSIGAGYYQNGEKDCIERLAQSIRRANTQMHQLVWKQSGSSRFLIAGATCAAVVLYDGMAYGANAGSDRAYLVRQGQARQCSTDHTLRALIEREGLPPQEQGQRHRDLDTTIYRFLGDKDDIEVDTFVEPAQDGDIWLLCTDGLHRFVTDEELSSTINHHELQESVERLILLAKEHGSWDDITAMAVKVSLQERR